MIITKTWLEEFINLENFTLDEIVKTLNNIGVEVANFGYLKAPDNVVVGLVKEKIKHENSDKLNITQVEVGENKILQIVCGAPNVEAGQYVPVALCGTTMPNGLQIKKAKLRGVESNGMICSASELGFEKVNDGILILDESIGELKLGAALSSYDIFNDYFIEVELTPNRGDLLSVYGIARDLAVALNVDLHANKAYKECENVLGIGRILRLNVQKDIHSFFVYRAIELKAELNISLKIALRLAQAQLLLNKIQDNVKNLLNYATYSTGVLFNAYDFNALSKEENELSFNISLDESGASKVSCDDITLSYAGILQNEKTSAKANNKIIIIEANYTDPLIIANAKNAFKEKDEKSFYRSFRGSEPNLSLGMNFLLNLACQSQNIVIYSSSQHFLEKKESEVISLNLSTLNKIIGQEIHKDEVVRILKKLGFELIHSDNQTSVKAPLHRHDIKNLADICEEVVRIVGIDNIKSLPLEFGEKDRHNETLSEYKNLLNLRQKAANNGYFESLHYVLDNSEELKSLGFELPNLKLLNPITAELNTLRSTLLNHLLNAASLNLKNNKKIIKLFETGAVFNAANMQKQHFAMIHTGLKDEAKISNKAKPSLVSFYDFLLDLQNIIGKFELKNTNLSFLSPYERAEIYQNSVKIGFVGRLHIKIEDERDLLKSYVCEISLDALKHKEKTAKAYSKFPSMSRDLSVLIPKGFAYENIKEAVKSLKIDILESFRVVDLYSDENLKDSLSLTINFTFRDFNTTLEEAQVNTCIDEILSKFKEMGLNLR